MVNVIQYKQGRGKGGWQLSKSCCESLACRSRRSEAVKWGTQLRTTGYWSQLALWPGQEGQELNTLRIGTGSCEQPLWIIHCTVTSESIFLVPGRCTSAIALVIWCQETRSTLWPSSDLMRLETSQWSCLPLLVPVAEISVNSWTCLFPALRQVLSFSLFFFPPCVFPLVARLSFHQCFWGKHYISSFMPGMLGAAKGKEPSQCSKGIKEVLVFEQSCWVLWILAVHRKTKL